MYTLSEISNILEGQLIGRSNSISRILTDSRSFERGTDLLFVALRGKNHDGHSFINALEEKGICNFLVEEVPVQHRPESSFVLVANTLHALQKFAEHHRSRFNVQVVGITGSNGKTVVKEWLNHLLQNNLQIVRSPKSYNSQLGVPLSVLNLDAVHQLAIFEAGISQMDEMGRLQPIIQPTIGIFTNLGEAHQENFGSKQQKAEEKLKLYCGCEYLIYRTDYVEIQDALRKFDWPRTRFVPWSRNEAEVKTSTNNTEIHLQFRNESFDFRIPFTDEASIENAVHAFFTIKILEEKTGQKLFDSNKFTTLPQIEMRLELVHGANNCTILNDVYSNDLSSLKIALDLLAQQNQHSDSCVVLSDIHQSGRNESDLYERISELIGQSRVTRFVGIGEALMRNRALFPANSSFYSSTELFLKENPSSNFKNETVLLKGAREFKFERILSRLERKSHRTILEINLNHLQHNLNYFRSLLKPETKVMVMVKAFSYGSGSYEIANWLQHQRVDYLGVAYTDEGVELRKAGIDLPIMVMNPNEDNFQQIIDFQLEPELYDFSVLETFEKELRRNAISKYPVHIKLDTGMRRLGFELNEVEKLGFFLGTHPQLRVQSVFSHLVASDNAEHNAFTLQQISSFEQACSSLRNELKENFDRHILNSAGIEHYAQAQFEMVRLGIGLYGLSQNKENTLPISTLKTKISQIKNIAKGESVGYNRNWVAKRDSVIATLPVGYADCLDRKLGNGVGEVLLHGKRAPIVGNVCMDMCMIDITNIEAEAGNEVIVFGQNPRVDEVAEKIGTIPYEVLTSISPRVKRVYFQE